MFIIIVFCLGFIAFMGGIGLLILSSDIGLSNLARGNIRRTSYEGIKKYNPHTDPQLAEEVVSSMESNAEKGMTVIRWCAYTLSMAICLCGFVVWTFALFFGSKVGNPPVWEATVLPLQQVYPDLDYYVLETNQGYWISSPSTGTMLVEKDEVSFSLNSPENFWSKIVIKEVLNVEPSMTVYHGTNNTDNTYTRIVLLVPQGSVYYN